MDFLAYFLSSAHVCRSGAVFGVSLMALSLSAAPVSVQGYSSLKRGRGGGPSLLEHGFQGFAAGGGFD